jgi:hypothetical protein
VVYFKGAEQLFSQVTVQGSLCGPHPVSVWCCHSEMRPDAELIIRQAVEALLSMHVAQQAQLWCMVSTRMHVRWSVLVV